MSPSFQMSSECFRYLSHWLRTHAERGRLTELIAGLATDIAVRNAAREEINRRGEYSNEHQYAVCDGIVSGKFCSSNINRAESTLGLPPHSNKTGEGVRLRTLYPTGRHTLTNGWYNCKTRRATEEMARVELPTVQVFDVDMCVTSEVWGAGYNERTAARGCGCRKQDGGRENGFGDLGDVQSARWTSRAEPCQKTFLSANFVNNMNTKQEECTDSGRFKHRGKNSHEMIHAMTQA
ncbi:hypothetical protein B0H16DRAFT_1776479 [Mycena metata]|uniref:Uncharacterized protein n=1 Tax=Mycena metata TaxID=1033252 RepID=A0AAD7MRL9_9AGAR|nr:hypothetical protein B0H16DRAFT_1776479 [Mycena metata]